MDSVKISFDVSPSDKNCPIGIEIWLDQICVCQTNHLADTIHFEHQIEDDENEHELKIVINGKTSDHTVIDQQGNIVKDATVSIGNFIIDDLDVNQLILEKITYVHNFNGSQPEITDTFYGTAGCNGVLSFKFSTPIYLWLLENM